MPVTRSEEQSSKLAPQGRQEAGKRHLSVYIDTFKVSTLSPDPSPQWRKPSARLKYHASGQSGLSLQVTVL